MIKVSASVLAFDLANLQAEVKALEKANVDFIHIDVMDGKFVPNITMGSCFVSAIKKNTDLPLDVHLMIENPQRYIDDFAKAGADMITIHLEAATNPERILTKIKSLNIMAGLSLKPDTNVEKIFPYLNKTDIALVMTVMPGFAGQDFIPDAANNISKIKQQSITNNLDVMISVDGGINYKTKDICIKNGAQILVSGSYIAKNQYFNAINTLKS